MLTAEGGLSEIIEFLLSLPEVNINAQNSAGETAFMIACKNSHHHAVSTLLNDHRFIANICTASQVAQSSYLKKLDCPSVYSIFSKKLEHELCLKSVSLPRSVSDSNILFSLPLIKSEYCSTTLAVAFSKKRQAASLAPTVPFSRKK